MVGLPWEEHADVEAIVDLTEQIRERMLARRPQARPRRPHPPVGEPVRAQAGHALPVAAHGGPEGDRPQAAVPAQGLRHACRTWTPICKSARTGVHQSILALADRRVADALEMRGHRGRRPEARDEGGGPRPGFLPVPRTRPRTRSCPGTSSTTACARPTTCGSSTRAAQERLSPHCPEIQGCIRCGVCVETPNPSYRLPDKWKELGTSPRYLRMAPTA